MDERGGMTEIFRSTRKCRTCEAFLQSRLRPLARRKHPAGSTAQRAANEDDPGFYPLRVIYGGHCPPWSRVGQSFLWIGTPMTVAGTSMARAPRRLRLVRFAKPPEVSPACATAR